MKRIQLNYLVLMMMAWSAISSAAHDFEVNGIYYNINGSEVTVTCQGTSYSQYSNEYSGSVIIPSSISYNGVTYSVTSIGDCAFQDCSAMTYVTIPNTILSIGNYAFKGCSSLISITIPETVNYIGRYAFQGCTALTTLNYNAVSCNDFVITQYSNGQIEKESIPFYNLNISNINIGSSVQRIPRFFACGLTKVSSVTLPNSVTSIGYDAFAETAWYDNQPDGLVYAGLVAYQYKGTMSSGTNVTIRNGTLGIADLAFWNCTGMTSVTIPNSVTSIGSSAFLRCSGLTSITIPNSVTSIGSSAFDGCSGVTSVSIGYSVTSIGDNAFEQCTAMQTLYFNAISCAGFTNSNHLYNPFNGLNIQTIIIGDSVRSIPSYFATDLTHLSHLTIGKSVIGFGTDAFKGCSGLTDLEWNAKKCSSVGNMWSYISTENIVRVTIGPEVEILPNFFVCGSKINEVSIPNSVTSIGSCAFSGCSNLTSVTIPAAVNSIRNEAFQGCTSLATLNYNAVSCTDFSSTTSYRPFYGLNISSINIGNNVQRIPAYFAHGLTGLTSITIPNSVNSIGNYAFQGCTSLATLIFNADSCADFGSGSSSSCPFSNLNISNLYIGNKVKKIPSFFAYGLNKLTSISIPNSVTSIGGYAFYGCSMLNSVNIGNSVTSIGNYTFYGCSGLSGLTIPNSVTSIGNSAFYGCNGLSSVFIPNSVTSIGNNAFQNCNGLSQVSISDITAWCGINFGSSTANPLYYAHHLYLNSAEVTDLVVPTTVDNIRNYAFYGCSGLTNLTIPNSVTTIGSSAFYGCSGLTNLTIPNSVTSIGNSAFQGCSALQTLIFNAESCNNFNSNSSYHPFYNLNISKINIGNSVVTIPAYFAYGLTKLTNVTIGNSVTSIGNNAFTGCTGLIRVDISDLAKWCRINFGSATTNPLYYAQHLYLNDNEVINLVVPNDVDAIGDYAFYNCSLTSVKLHQSLASVGKQAFNNSPTIETVTCAATTPPSWNDLAMFTTNVFNHTPLYVPIGSERAYMIDQCWGQFATIIGKDIQNEILATSISLNQSQLSLQVGNTSQLIATILPDSATNTSVTWLSNAPSVASVDENGLVTALAVGNATITATTTDGSNLSASCGVTVTEDLSEYDNYLSLNNLEASRGDTIVIPVTMTNTESIISFQTDIILPEGLELLKEDGEYIIDPSSRMTRTHSIMSNDVSSGAIRVLCYSSNYKPFTGNSGDDLFYITVKVADDAEGDYIIQLKNTLLTNTDFVDLAAPDVAANVNVKAYLLGDANNSGTVTITDVVVTAQYVLELNPQPFVFEAADANVDGNITVADVSRIAWMVLNPAQNAPLRAPALWNNGDRMSAEDITLAAGETRRVSILLDNEMDYSAFQLDLNLPEGLTASNFQLTDRASSHAFDVNTLLNGNIRALCYSPALTTINGHEGALLTFDVTAAGNVNNDILVDGIELVTTNCQSVKLDAFSIGVNNASSFNESITGKAIAKVEYFNLAGQRMDQPSTGVTLVVTTYTDGSRTTSKVFD